MLGDSHPPPAQEMRDALSGKLITRIPLDADFMARFGQPYAVTHRADIHGILLNACRGNDLITLENNRRVDGFKEQGKRRRHAPKRRRDQGPRFDRLRRHVVGNPARASSATTSRACRAISPTAPYSNAPTCRPTCGGCGRSAVGRPAHPFRALSAAPGANSTIWSRCFIPTATRRAGTRKASGKELLWQHFKGQRPEVLRMLERIETWRMWVLCDREPVREWSKGRVDFARRCRPSDAAIPRTRRLHGGRGCGGTGGKSGDYAR